MADSYDTEENDPHDFLDMSVGNINDYVTGIDDFFRYHYLNDSIDNNSNYSDPYWAGYHEASGRTLNKPIEQAFVVIKKLITDFNNQ